MHKANTEKLVVIFFFNLFYFFPFFFFCFEIIVLSIFPSMSQK